mgnify:CR=1 FL=1
MKLSAPTQPLFVVSLVLAGLGLLGRFAVIQVISPNAYWLLLAGYVVLLVGVVLKGR